MAFLELVLAGVIAASAERSFVSEEAGFEAAFPVAPAHRVMAVRTPEGPQTRHAFRVSNEQGSFYVLFACTPPPTLPSDSIWSNFRYRTGNRISQLRRAHRLL